MRLSFMLDSNDTNKGRVYDAEKNVANESATFECDSSCIFEGKEYAGHKKGGVVNLKV